ncbi:MAG: hypothetical protein RSA27_01360, partial [Oscillospiraceae bacterium]
MGIQKRLGFLLILCIMCQILCFTASAEGGCEVITNAANAISYSGFTPGENGIEVLSPGSVTYEFTVPKDGYYKLSMEMGFYLNINELGANGAAVAIQLDNSKMIALSKNNLIDKGKAPGWHKTNYEYLYSILLTSGTHQISFTSSVYEKQTPEFQLAKFIISPTNDT